MAHPVDHDLLDDPGVLRVVPAQRDRPEAHAPRIRPGQVAALLAHGPARPRRRHPAPRLHVPAPADRHPQAGGHHLPAVHPAHAGLVLRRPGQHDPLLGPARPGLHVRHRRRLVLRLHALHRVFLPQAPVGHRPGPAGRHREPGHERHPAGRPRPHGLRPVRHDVAGPPRPMSPAITPASRSGSTTRRSSSSRGASWPRSWRSSGCAMFPSRPTSSSSSTSSPTPTPGT